jgi:thymidylate synthase
MQLLVLITGDYGRRHVENLQQHAPSDWEIRTWETPHVLPPVLDYPEDYLPDSLPPADLVLSLAEVRGAAELIPEIAAMTGARAVIAPIDNTAWLPVGLARQLREWLARMDIPCVTPMPFCSLTETHYNALRLREPYDDPLIRAFARHFGQPAFEATVDPDTRQIESLTVTRDACCGCAHYVAEKLAGTPVDDAVDASGLHHHHYPCQASMGIHPQYGDTLMHVSGNLMKDAVKHALAGHLQVRYVRPAGYVEDDDAPSDE